MKTLCTLFAFFVGISFAISQNPAILWQKTIGGDNFDVMLALEPTPDGGYIMGGYSTSNASGEKSENSKGSEDIWIVKVDGSGNILWQKTIGGSGQDFIFSIKPTTDGGYIVGAASDSNISGDKTENSRGGLDYWIFKLDNSGNITWQKTYGGNQPEFDVHVFQTPDGGYFAAGYSDSGISGDKTSPSYGQRDFWALKIDNSGTIVWQKALGGSLVDRVQMAIPTSDGNYLIGGFSNSGISGTKTEINRGGSDFWIVKLAPNGNILWDKTYGGNTADVIKDMIETADGGYLIGGYSASGISGDKTENTRGVEDYWILKLNNNGNLIWQKTIGGSMVDYLRDIKQLPNGNYLIAGYSESGISGDKTHASKGMYDLWLVNLDSDGNLLAQNSLGGSKDESGPYILPLTNGEFLVGCSSDSNISGDKTENSRGLEDYWLFKTSADILGLSENTSFVKIDLYPNPTNGEFTIELGKAYSEVHVQIYNGAGQLISSEKFTSAKSISTAIIGESGVYLVKIRTKEAIRAMKVIKR